MEHYEGARRRDDSKCDKFEARLRVVEGTMTRHDALLIRLDADVYNHGQKGLLTNFNAFTASHDSQEREREKQQVVRHNENAERLQDIANKMGHKSLSWTIAGVAVALAGCAIAALAIIVMVRLANQTGNLDPAKLFHSQSLDPALSYLHNQQSTSIPPLR